MRSANKHMRVCFRVLDGVLLSVVHLAYVSRLHNVSLLRSKACWQSDDSFPIFQDKGGDPAPARFLRAMLTAEHPFRNHGCSLVDRCKLLGPTLTSSSPLWFGLNHGDIQSGTEPLPPYRWSSRSSEPPRRRGYHTPFPSLGLGGISGNLGFALVTL